MKIQQSSQRICDQTVVVILAAGKGTRMGREDLVKVCFEIDSVPAVNRQIGVLKKLGFHRFLLVVGTMAEQVLGTVTQEHPGAMYVFQQPQLGTGHAARIAAEALQTIDYQGHVLVAAGDSHLEPQAIDALVSGYVKQQADMSLAIVPKRGSGIGSLGRVLVGRDGQALDIIESNDLARQAVIDSLKKKLGRGARITGSDVLDLAQRHIPSALKREVALGDLLTLAGDGDALDQTALSELIDSDKYNLLVDGKRRSAKEIESLAKGGNMSLYLFRADVLYQGVSMLDNNNAQGEYYLTDVVRILSGIRNAQGKRQYRVRAVTIDNSDWIQAFNSPDELVTIQDYVRRKKLHGARAVGVADRPRLKSKQYCTVQEWLSRLDAGKPGFTRWLRNVYGTHEDLHREKIQDLTRVLKCYGRRFDFDQKVCIVRAPGRINLMGRHVDHRGGMSNFLAIDRETIAVVGLRDDQTVSAVNTAPDRFPPVEFNISEMIGQFAWSDWINVVNSNWVRNMLYAAPGDWGHYIKAALLRLQHRFQDVKIRGVNVALCGNVPIAAGLGSSSTIVVATLQAALALNGFELSSQQFIDLSGEGEWFVGSPRAAADHAAIYLGQRGKIAQVGYLPFRVGGIIDAPRDYQVIIANSHIQPAKSGMAKHVFNARVADYNLGLALFKQRCPQVAGAVEYVRDIHPEKLGCATSEIYRMLFKVPERITRDDFKSLLSSEHHEMLEANFATHADPEYYHPRGVLLYGAAEIARSRMCVNLLEKGQVEEFGRLMTVSHDGDRVSRLGDNGKYQPLEADCSDQYLYSLIGDLGSEDPVRVLRAQLYMQPGSYACSTPEIDHMVDIASSVPGVAGAQIAGAALGGCIMVLAHKEAVEAVRKSLIKQYYRPAGLKPAVLPCTAVEGAGLAES